MILGLGFNLRSRGVLVSRTNKCKRGIVAGRRFHIIRHGLRFSESCYKSWRIPQS